MCGQPYVGKYIWYRSFVWGDRVLPVRTTATTATTATTTTASGVAAASSATITWVTHVSFLLTFLPLSTPLSTGEAIALPITVGRVGSVGVTRGFLVGLKHVLYILILTEERADGTQGFRPGTLTAYDKARFVQGHDKLLHLDQLIVVPLGVSLLEVIRHPGAGTCGEVKPSSNE